MKQGTDEQIENAIGIILRTGVIAAAAPGCSRRRFLPTGPWRQCAFVPRFRRGSRRVDVLAWNLPRRHGRFNRFPLSNLA